MVLLQVNCIEFKSRMWVSSLPLTVTDRPASIKVARHHSRYICRLQLEHKAATPGLVTLHIARAINIQRDHI